MGRVGHPLGLSSVFRLVLQAGFRNQEGNIHCQLSQCSHSFWVLGCCYSFVFVCFIVAVSSFRARVGVKSISGSGFGAGSAEHWESGHLQCFQGKKSHLALNLGSPLVRKDAMTRLLLLPAFPFWFSTLLTLQVG